MKLKFIDKDEKKKGPIFKRKDGDNIKPIGTYKPNKNTGEVQFKNAKRESFPIYKSATGNVIKDIKKSLYTSEDVKALGAGGNMSEAEEKKYKENVAGAAALKAREDKMPASVKKYKAEKEEAALLAEAEASLKGGKKK